MELAFSPNATDVLQARIQALKEENRALRAKHSEASRLLGEQEDKQAELQRQNASLTEANESSAQLLAEIATKNEHMAETNKRLSASNARAAELMAELEFRNDEIQALNSALSRANAESVEMISNIEGKNVELNEANRRLAYANAEAAELLAEIEIKNRRIEKLNETLRHRNKEIALLSVSDALTGVFNRNYLNRQLALEIRRAWRYGRSLSVVLCDLDHFKAINDQHGHQAGDAVLKEFASCLRSNLREDVDWVVRYGGEEFLMVLPETDLQGAVCCAERCRSLLGSAPFCPEGAGIRVSASFGVAVLTDHSENDAQAALESLIGRADSNLYAAKRAGRNCVLGKA